MPNFQAEEMDPISELEVTEHVLGIVMTQQYSLNTGLKKIEKYGYASVKKKLFKLHDMNTFTPVDGSHLRKEEKKDTTTSLIFLTKKSYSRIKGRECADGRGQREKFEK